MLNITNGTGFQMGFENGWTVSVQFSKFHYSGQNTAEIAAWCDEWHRFEDDGMVKGWCTANEVAEFITFISQK